MEGWWLVLSSRSERRSRSGEDAISQNQSVVPSSKPDIPSSLLSQTILLIVSLIRVDSDESSFRTS